MRKLLPLLLLLLTEFAIAQAPPPEGRDFSFNMVRMIEGRTSKEAPQYGFITGTNKTNDQFYFVMIYPEKIEPSPEITVNYLSQGLVKESMLSARANLIQYEGVVLIGGSRLVVYQADGRATIKHNYFRDPKIEKRDNHKIYIDRTPRTAAFTPDIYDPWVEMNAKSFDKSGNSPLSFRLSKKIPDLIMSGYPVVDAEGFLNGVISAPKGNEDFDMIRMIIIKDKLIAMSNNGYACQYFNLIFEGKLFNQCDNDRGIDSLEKVMALNKKRRDQAILDNKNYPLAIGIKAGASGQYTNVSGTVSPGYGYFGGIDFHLLPDSGAIGFSIRPRYGVYHYDPNYYGSTPTVNGTNQSYEYYEVKRAKREQIDLQFMAEIKFNRRLHGHNYLGLGYSKSFTRKKSFQVQQSNGIANTFILPTDDRPDAFLLEIGWDTGKIRYAFTTAYSRNDPFPRDYSVTVNNTVLRPFADVSKHYLFLNFEFAFRLWGHWRNGIKG